MQPEELKNFLYIVDKIWVGPRGRNKILPQVLTKESTYAKKSEACCGKPECGLCLETVKSLDLFSWFQEGASLEVRKYDLTWPWLMASPQSSHPTSRSNGINFPQRVSVRFKVLSKRWWKLWEIKRAVRQKNHNRNKCLLSTYYLPGTVLPQQLLLSLLDSCGSLLEER